MTIDNRSDVQRTKVIVGEPLRLTLNSPSLFISRVTMVTPVSKRRFLEKQRLTLRTNDHRLSQRYEPSNTCIFFQVDKFFGVKRNQKNASAFHH